MWLYSAIAPRYGATPMTVALAGTAWWVMKTLQSAKWAGCMALPLYFLILIDLSAAWSFSRSAEPAGNLFSLKM